MNVEVLFLGFTATRETFDHQLEADGKGDEVFLAASTMRKTEGGRIVNVHDDHFIVTVLSGVMGDVNNHPERWKCGSARGGMGGIRSGDSCPSREPWVFEPNDVNGYDPDNLVERKRPPMTVSSFLIQEGAGSVRVTPTLWEWDGGGNRDVRWYDGTLSQPATTQPVEPVQEDACADYRKTYTYDPNVASGCVDVGSLWEGIKDLFSFGRAEDRPIGVTGTNDFPSFAMQYLDLDYSSALATAAADTGHGPGVVALRYKENVDAGDDLSDWIADYWLYLKVVVN